MEVARKELYDFISGMTIIDCHEHLVSEKTALEQPVDFSLLFDQYCRGDLETAGMTREEMSTFYDCRTPVEEKWELLSRYYPLVEDTSYFRSAKIVMEHDYGIKDLTMDNCRRLSQKIRSRRKPGFYREAFRNCGIRYALNNADCDSIPAGAFFQASTDLLKTVVRVPLAPKGADFHARQENNFFSSVKSADDLDDLAKKFVEKIQQIGGCGIKVMNDYAYEPCDGAAAAGWVKRLLQEENLESIALYWYVLDRILEAAAKADLPICIHTGYWGDFRRQSPEKYIPLIDNHPTNRFDVFHLGYPYVKSSLMLAKTRRQVYLNLCWTYIISGQLAYEGLRQIIDLLPMNKIMGFGGDFYAMERVFGSREMMNQTLSQALAYKVADGTLSLRRAKKWAQALLWENPKAFYGV